MRKLLTTTLLVLMSFAIFGQVEMGSSTNYTKIEGDGTVEFNGDATVWDDYVVPFASAKLKGTKEPKWEPFIGAINQYNFEEGAEQEVGMSIQLPHSWNGTAIHPHIHWSPEDGGTGDVIWVIEYTWVNYNATTQYVFPAAVPITTTTTVSGDSHKHLITSFGAITPDSGTTNPQNAVSSILLIRFYRDGTNNNDTYDAGAFALSFDIHFEKNTVGSRQEYIK
jgi:predicted secreted Zn-dependent protease